MMIGHIVIVMTMIYLVCMLCSIDHDDCVMIDEYLAPTSLCGRLDHVK
jgi:hypothetical protein